MSTGEYQSTICLAGWMWSAWDLPPAPNLPTEGSTTVNFDDPRATDITSMRYQIRLTAGNGAMAIRFVNGSATSTGWGAVQIIPSAESCTATMTAFALLGGFSLFQ